MSILLLHPLLSEVGNENDHALPQEKLRSKREEVSQHLLGKLDRERKQRTQSRAKSLALWNIIDGKTFQVLLQSLC